MGIRVDALPTTALPNRAHVVPAMREGLTVKLTVAQILGLALGSDVTVDPSGFVNLSATKVQAMMAQIDALFTAYLSKSGNLSGLASVSTSLDNLGFSTLGKTLRAVADAGAARSAIAACPVPVTGTGLSGWSAISAASGNALSLPAGGQWAWLTGRFNNSGIWASVLDANVNSGGTQIAAATANVTPSALVWRVA